MHAALTTERRIAARCNPLLPEIVPPGSRGTILTTALRLFAEQGYAGASIRDIAAASDLKPATIYSHYPSKEHVLAEICRIGHDEHARRIRDALFASLPAPRHQLAAWVRAHVSLHADFPMLAVVANAEMHQLGNELGERSFALRNQTIEILSDLIKRGVDDGSFDTPDVWLATAAIGAMGLRVAYWFSPEHDKTATEVADAYVLYALRLLAAAPLELEDAAPDGQTRNGDAHDHN